MGVLPHLRQNLGNDLRRLVDAGLSYQGQECWTLEGHQCLGGQLPEPDHGILPAHAWLPGRIEQLMYARISGSSTSERAVSYTHLDVYKRQA